MYKKKLSELENNVKIQISNRSKILIENEKEKARWTFEKEHLISEKNEFMEQVSRLERKKDYLLRENEKLKNELKKSKKLA